MALGLRAAHSQNFLGDDFCQKLPDVVLKRRTEVVWSLIILESIFADRQSSLPATAASFGLSMHEKSASPAPDVINSPDERHGDDISAINITLVHIWRDTVSYIAARNQESVSFWAATSGRSRIMSRVLDLEISKYIRSSRSYRPEGAGRGLWRMSSRKAG